MYERIGENVMPTIEYLAEIRVLRVEVVELKKKNDFLRSSLDKTIMERIGFSKREIKIICDLANNEKCGVLNLIKRATRQYQVYLHGEPRLPNMIEEVVQWIGKVTTTLVRKI